ncbi:lysophospholipid acyltransferase family protein [Nitrincola iocasae]|uniref:L-ornithine N(alpha)-acyltransferase n=1 Tax=Nitrincola iocasae TaxID=2614693 RepID=A0A5J6LIV8_9GAMM|nr:lysophospholipid acyltransferase family protein [Nitrincola iocasae]QEW08242.1 GNAT family N-acetyltransferase [Nitrincola iocasae]
MLNIEALVSEKYPALAHKPAVLKTPVMQLLRHLFHEDEVNQFLHTHQDLGAFEFTDKVLEHFRISYLVSAREKENIPSEGRVVIVSNHPLGTLDGLVLLKLVGEVRRDIKILANDLLWQFAPLRPLLLPVDNLTQSGYRKTVREVTECLKKEQAVIIFPAGEVSRATATGIKDGAWQSGFVHFARKTNAPILPIHLNSKNSAIFYSLSMIYRPIGGLMLVNEMFKKNAEDMPVRIGELIPLERFDNNELPLKTRLKLLRKHVYRLPKNKKSLFVTEKPIAHPEERQLLRRELRKAECLGQTQDGMHIYLFDYASDSPVMRELGRLRELTFRRVGEGTGQRYDLDSYDRNYKHLVLWDDEALELVGAYRIGECASVIRANGLQGLYAASLFSYQPELEPMLENAIELGRSFVQPRYWGRRSLDYLWYGIGAYLKSRPHIDRMLGPVSISAKLPQIARDLLVIYYRHYYGLEKLAKANAPYSPSDAGFGEAQRLFCFKDAREDFIALKERLDLYGVTVPTLYKQYTELCVDKGVHFLDFSVDADFGYCIDGLVMVNVADIKAKKRQRYMGELNT